MVVLHTIIPLCLSSHLSETIILKKFLKHHLISTLKKTEDPPFETMGFKFYNEKRKITLSWFFDFFNLVYLEWFFLFFVHQFRSGVKIIPSFWKFKHYQKKLCTTLCTWVIVGILMQAGRQIIFFYVSNISKHKKEKKHDACATRLTLTTSISIKSSSQFSLLNSPPEVYIYILYSKIVCMPIYLYWGFIFFLSVFYHSKSKIKIIILKTCPYNHRLEIEINPFLTLRKSI